jgi:ABC-type amino acid transport substrate-binding protein
MAITHTECMKNFVCRWAGITAALALLLSAPAAGSATTTGEAGTEIPVLVADQTDANGQPMPGLVTMTGIVKLLAAESGLNLVVHPYPWRRAQMMAKNGEGLLYGAAETPERASFFNFTRPLYSVNQWLVTPAQRPVDFNRWEDLRGKVISISSGGRFGAEFEEHRGKTFTVEDNAATMSARFKMMTLGRVDALLIDSYRAAPQLEARLNCLYADIGKWAVMAKPVNMEPALIAVPKASPLNNYLPVLNDAIDRLVKARSIQKFLDKRAVDVSC